MMDELLIEELAVRRLHEKMDDAWAKKPHRPWSQKSRALEFRRLSRLSQTRTEACDRATLAAPCR
jgi:hypothetical protein